MVASGIRLGVIGGIIAIGRIGIRVGESFSLGCKGHAGHKRETRQKSNGHDGKIYARVQAVNQKIYK